MSKELELSIFKKSQERQSLNQQYFLYQKRYLMATFFATSTICSSMMFSTCNPIGSELTSIYAIPTYLVALSANGFLLMHPIFTFLQTYIVNQYSIGLSLKIGCILTLLGSLIRAMTYFTSHFSTVILGQIVGGMGRPFIINIQANVAREWFRPEDKTSVMMAFSFLITCSNILGVLLPGMIFRGYHFDGNPQQGKSLTSQLMIIEVFLFSIFQIPAIFLFESSPPTPPGPISRDEQQFTYKQSLQNTVRNKSFIRLFFCYSLIMGGFHALAVIIAYLFSPFGYHPDQIKSSPIFFGFISSVLYSILIKKFKWNLKKTVMINMFPVVIILGLAYWFIKSESYFLVLLCFAFLGFFVIPVIPLLLEIACQVLYPINQSIAVGFLLAGVHLWSFLYGEFLSWVMRKQTQRESFLGCFLLFLSFLLAYMLFIFVKLPQKDKVDEIEDFKTQDDDELQQNQQHEEGI